MLPQSIAHYRITGKLGEGGMGAVYRATDTKLNRDVAIKVLPDAFATDPDRLARFTREAQVLASLNHPNIAAVFGIEERAIVMELIDGPTLADRIAASPIPLDELLPIARQMAEALEAAHEKNIIHRDLKPANIKVTPTGAVKVLDFGLAKLSDPAETPDTGALAPTIVKGQSPTAAGVIMGTAEYMSPEQASGKSVDKRSDIWSFGVVLHEMLTGRRLFNGETMSHTLADVLRAPIDFSLLPNHTPPFLRQLLTRCLQRDPKKRLRDIGEARLLLDAPTSAEHAPASVPPQRRVSWLWPALTTAAILAAAASWYFRPQPKPLPDPQLTRFTGDPGLTLQPTISPDGRLVAYSSDRAGRGDLDIWVQLRSGGDPIRVAQEPTDESNPSFSPDGSQIVYTRPDGLFAVPALGGEPRQLTKGGTRARFSPDGKHLAYQTRSSGNAFANRIYLFAIGSEQPAVISGDVRACDYPIWSPDGKHILFVGDREWYLFDVGSGKLASLGPSPGMPAQWLPGDRILFVDAGNPSRNGLATVKLAVSRAQLETPPMRLVNGPVFLESPSVATDGTLAVGVGSFRTNLWTLPIDTNTLKVQSAPVPLTNDIGVSAYPSISTDGGKLAFTSDATGIRKVWMLDLETGRRRMVIPSQTAEYRPILSPDGGKLAFTSGTGTKRVTMVADVSNPIQPGPARQICDPTCTLPWAWFPDNRAILSGTKAGIGLLPLNGTPVPFAEAGPMKSLFQAHPSPDGRWLVIMGAGKMYIVRLIDGKPATQSEWKPIVPGNTDLYRWSPDGNTIYFISNRDQFRCIWAQRLQPVTKEPLGPPVAVFHAHGARISMNSILDSGAVGLAIARDRIIFAQSESAGNIWLGKLE